MSPSTCVCVATDAITLTERGYGYGNAITDRQRDVDVSRKT